jgi:mitogen-activated protein kinase 7
MLFSTAVQPATLRRHAFDAFNTKFEVFNHFIFVKELGTGASGVVAAAKHIETGVQCAIKKVTNISVKVSFPFFYWIDAVVEGLLQRINARRCLREMKYVAIHRERLCLTQIIHRLLRHFRGHANVSVKFLQIQNF